VPLHNKLEKLSQGYSQSVIEFVYELEELFNLIGAISERDRVLKLWNGLRFDLQTALWRDGLHPEVSTWEEVVGQAETIEISRNVTGRSHGDQKKGEFPRKPKGNNYRSRESSGKYQHPNYHRDSQFKPDKRGHEKEHHQKGKQSRFDHKRENKGKPHAREKERTEQIASGSCFNCGEEGHFARNCPKNNTVKMGGSKPPGVNNFNVELSSKDNSSDMSVEVLEGLPLGMIQFEESNEHLPSWMRRSKGPRHQIGRAYALRAEFVLTSNQPYFGDENYGPFDPNNRFLIKSSKRDALIIKDYLTDFKVKIHEGRLLNPKFNLANWYDKKRARHLSGFVHREPNNSGKMGDALIHVALPLLESGISSCYPNITPPVDGDTRFEMAANLPERDHYIIWDLDLGKCVEIPRVFLEQPTFDLVSWYREQINKDGYYNSLYTKEMLRTVDKIKRSQTVEENTTLEGLVHSPHPFRVELSSDFNDYDSDLEWEEISSNVTPEDMPDLQSVTTSSLTDDAQSAPEQETPVEPSQKGGDSGWDNTKSYDESHCQDEEVENGEIGDPLAIKLKKVLAGCQPYPGDNFEVSHYGSERFKIEKGHPGYYIIYDKERWMESYIHRSRLEHSMFSAGRWLAEQCTSEIGCNHPWFAATDWFSNQRIYYTLMGDAIENRVEHLLESGIPYDCECKWPDKSDRRFSVVSTEENAQSLMITDKLQGLVSYLPRKMIEDPKFNVWQWYQMLLDQFELDNYEFPPNNSKDPLTKTNLAKIASDEDRWPNTLLYINGLVDRPNDSYQSIRLNGVQVDRGHYAAVQRNAATVKDKSRLLPKPIVLKVRINGHPARALVDSGSQGDFISTTLADQLKLPRLNLDKPVKLQLAVQGSRSVINLQTEARFQFEGIDENRRFDIINLNNYDMILGTPWLYQHQVSIGLHPARIRIDSNKSIPIQRDADTKPLANAVTFDTNSIEAARGELMGYAEPLCREMGETELPPLRAINHKIPLIDEQKTYPWRPSRCPASGAMG